MTSLRVPATVFIVLAAAFVIFLVSSTSTLPPRVATHFNFQGQPDGWMRSSSYMPVFAAFGLGLPALVVAVFYMVRWLPARSINIPQGDYWLAPERLSDMHRHLLTYGLWFACMMQGFMFALHYAVVRANQLAPPHLAPKTVFVLMGIFFVTLAIWMVAFFRRFRRVPSG